MKYVQKQPDGLKNIKLLKEQYPSLQKWGDDNAFIIYREIQEQQLIKEFLYTVEPNKTYEQLMKRIGPDSIKVRKLIKGDKIIQIEILFLNRLIEDITKVNKLMDILGWHPSFINYKNGGKYSAVVSDMLDFKNVIVKYNANYDMEIKVKSPYLYHVTPDIKFTKIKMNGLNAKTQSKLSDHPGRIYLLDPETNPDIRGVVLETAIDIFNNYDNKNLVKEMYVLRVNMSKLKKLKFFEDPIFDLGNAIWTYENIPPYAIEVIDKIDPRM